MAANRWGMTVPFNNVPLAEHADLFRELADLGYTDAWSSEVDGTDGFTPLALAAAWAPKLRLGNAIIPAYLRGPALLAQTVATMAETAPGRFSLGLGTSSNVIVERWNGIPFDKPYARVRDTLRFLRAALAGEKVTETYETFAVKGFRLSRPPEQVPPLLLAALRPGMLRLAGREADGVILNWLSVNDVPTVLRHVAEGVAAGERDAGASPERDVVARIFVLPSEDEAYVREVGRRMIASYVTVPVYTAFHQWLGRGEMIAPLLEKWAAGDRKGALETIPDELVDDLIVHGSPKECREHLERYVAAGIKTPVMALIPADYELSDMLRELAPA
ncbi:MAG TPA: LLM class F420-dependent oxidoreductase [Frankiaceae bacterium]|nr:LLM class F420-dependent oxidoreductase [Frankiaceae bacterium]